MRTWTLAAIVLVSVWARTAAADSVAELDTSGGPQVLRELEHDTTIALDGAMAEVTERQLFVSTGDHPQVLRYRFPLPPDAVVTGLTVQAPGGKAAAAQVVDAEAAITPLPDADLLDGAPDLAALRITARTPRQAIYELRVYPVPAGGRLTVITRWIVPAHLDGGHFMVAVPGRGTSPALAVPKVTFTAIAPTGVSGFHELTGGGAVSREPRGSKPSLRFAAPGGADIVVSALPRVTGRTPLALISSAEIDPAHTAVAMAVIAPPPSPAEIPDYHRALFIVDTSPSMGDDGRAAARAIVGEVAKSLRTDSRTELVLFDSQARRVFGALEDNTVAHRKAMDEAIARAPAANGSNLGDALGLVRGVLGEYTADEATVVGKTGASVPTLIVIISDGLQPVDLTGERAMDRYGRDLFDRAFVVSVTLFPQAATPPEVAAAPAGAMALRAGGRALVLRDVEAKGAARRLAAELAQPAPLRGLALDSGAIAIDDLNLPGELAAGQGVLVVGTYPGKLPAKLVLNVFVGDDRVDVPVKSGGTVLARAALPLWLASRDPEAFLPDGSVGLAADTRRARLDYLKAAARGHAVTSETALVAVTPGDKLGQDRLAFAGKWGQDRYGRIPPPAGAEREAPEAADGTVKAAGRAHPSTVAPRRYVWVLDEEFVHDILLRQLAPRARVCYQKVLRQDPKAEGRIELVLELARGEMSSVSIGKSTFRSATLDTCLVAAGYEVQVPRLGAEVDDGTIVVARYPLTFRPANDGEVIDAPPETKPPALVDPRKGGQPIPQGAEPDDEDR